MEKGEKDEVYVLGWLVDLENMAHSSRYSD